MYVSYYKKLEMKAEMKVPNHVLYKEIQNVIPRHKYHRIESITSNYIDNSFYVAKKF